MNAVPLVVIGGYLGAGKTTLLNHLLREAGGQRIAVLVNDFGSVSIDADLIEGALDGVLALAGGCVCCSFGDDLIGSLQQVAAREPRPDLMLLECSGVGLPGAVARSAALARGVTVEGVAVVVDAAEVQRQAHDRYVGDTVRQQLRDADLLLLNQVDRCAPEALGAVRSWLATVAAGVPQAAADHGRIPAELVLGLHAAAARAAPTWLGAGGAYQEHRTSGPVAAHHFRFFEYPVAEPVDAQALAAELASSIDGLLRAKGVVRGLDGGLWTVQIMGRRVRVEPRNDRPAIRPGSIVCIAVAPR
jgi:G3E family GTPase